MGKLRHILIAFIASAGLASSTVFADPKIDTDVLGPAGKWPGFIISQRGEHVAVLLKTGSRFVVSIDAVEGPRIDKMLNLDGSPYFVSTSAPRTIPVLFSDDGAHCAYFGIVDDQYIVVEDGKELTRGKFTGSNLMGANLTFTSGGKHLIYNEQADNGYDVVVDGKAGPKSHTIPAVVCSPDGEHYAYIGTEADGNDTPWTLVDGKKEPFAGNGLQYTAKGHLLALMKNGHDMALTVDGQAGLTGTNINQLQVSPGGGEIAAMVYDANARTTMLNVNGKPVAGTEGGLLQKVYFSADDQHYAAIFTAPPSGKFAVIDGKKGEKYDDIGGGMGYMVNGDSAGRAWAAGRGGGAQIGLEQTNPTFPCFTSDGSKFVYVATSAGQQYLVTNDDESDGYQAIGPVLSPDGKRVGFITNAGPAGPTVVVDGKPIAIKPGPVSGATGTPSLTFSPDSAHTLAVVKGVVYLDGVVMPDVICSGQCLFSPDSQHLLLNGSSPSNPAGQFGIYLDGKLVAPGMRNASRPDFSPDSKHVFWVGTRAPQTSTDFDTAVLYIDGKPSSLNMRALADESACPWEISTEGVLTFTAQTGDELRRYHVTPGADTSLAGMLTDVSK